MNIVTALQWIETKKKLPQKAAESRMVLGCNVIWTQREVPMMWAEIPWPDQPNMLL